MKKIKSCLFILGGVFLSFFILCTCQNAEKLGEDLDASARNKSGIEISFNVASIVSDAPSTRAESSLEEIENLLIFIFKHVDGSHDAAFYLDFSSLNPSDTEIDVSRWNEEKVISIISSTILDNLTLARDIHVLANVEDSFLQGIDLDNITLEQLKAKETTPITEKIVYEEGDHFLMHGYVENHVFSSAVRVEVGLKRNIARVDLTVNTHDFQIEGNTIDFLPANSEVWMYVMNVPDRSFILDRPTELPSSLTLFSYDGEDLSETERIGTETSTFTSFYLNEYNLFGANQIPEDVVTAIILRIPYHVESTGKTYTHNYYKLLINNSIPYDIDRNTIYQVTANISTIGGETDLTAVLIDGIVEVIPWDERTLVSEISQTYLTVEETVVSINTEENFSYSSSGSISTTVSSTDSWLTAQVQSNNNIVITASGADYTMPRSGSFTIDVNNLSKKITVNQEATPVGNNGSIKLDKDVIYLSEVNPTATVGLTVTPTTSNWKKLSGSTTVATCSPDNGTGNATLTFTRGSVYDNTDYQFLNTNTLEYDNVQVCHLLLTVPDEAIGVPGTGGSYTEGEITALGGDFEWVVVAKSDWITEATRNAEGDLDFTAAAEPNELDRTGYIRIAHKNDLTYTKDIIISQSAQYIRFPEYDYLVIRYLWNPNDGRDVDTATEFSGTGVSAIEKKAVGYGMGNTTISYSGETVLQWGGDNTSSGYECAYINMATINDESKPLYGLLDRYVNLDLYATWFTTGVAPKPIQVEMTMYKGGIMQKINNYDYENIGGEMVYQTTMENVDITTTQGSNTYNRGGYVFIATIRYDKFKNTADLTRHAPMSLPLGDMVSETFVYPEGYALDPLPGESKEECERRLEEYRKKNTN